MDFVTDRSGRHLVRINEIMEVPEYVKQSSVDERQLPELADHQFADPKAREFPIDSPGHIFLSYGYCKSAGLQNQAILTRIEQAGQKMGVYEDLKRLDEAINQRTKEASADSEPEPTKYAVYLDFGKGDPESVDPIFKEGGVQGFYRIETLSDIEDSAVKLANFRQSLPLSVFVDGAQAIVKAAKEQGVSMQYIPRIIQDYGRDAMTNWGTVEHEAAKRKEATGDERYLEVAKTACYNHEERSGKDFAELWEELDRQNKVAYDHWLRDPYIIFLSGPEREKRAEELENWCLLFGTAVPKREIASFPMERLQSNFPKESAEQLTKIVKQASNAPGREVSQQLQELPDGVQRGFLRLLAYAG